MPDDPASIMIFAAGFGTRMGELTKTRPKPLIEVNDRALIDHALDLTEPFDLPIAINTHYYAEKMTEHLQDRPKITLSHEAPDILETGGGLKHALPLMPAGPVFTLNSDAIWAGPNPLEQLLKAWDPARMEALLMLIPKARCVGFTRRGDFGIAKDGAVTRDKSGLVYTGAQIIKTARIAKVKGTAFSLNPIWDEIIASNGLFGTVFPGQWADVGTPDGIAAAEDMLRNV